jgi:TATA-box binding protein (TBP) (component of TFIID and TFIIIB)
LILDFVDAHTKKLVFRGVGKAVVGGAGSNAKKISAAVAKIVDQFPRGG